MVSPMQPLVPGRRAAQPLSSLDAVSKLQWWSTRSGCRGGGGRQVRLAARLGRVIAAGRRANTVGLELCAGPLIKRRPRTFVLARSHSERCAVSGFYARSYRCATPARRRLEHPHSVGRRRQRDDAWLAAIHPTICCSDMIASSSSSTRSNESRAKSPLARPRSRQSAYSVSPCSPRSHLSPASARQPSVHLAPAAQPSVTYADRGTQYSPPDWPPTSSRSSRRPPAPHSLALPSHQQTQQQPGVSSGETAAPAAPPAKLAAVGPPKPEPDEPTVRVTPQSSLHNVGAAGRRSHSVAEPSADGTSSPELTAAKRSKQSHNTTKKIMPADYSQCDPKELALLISDMLMELIQFNDEIPLRDGHLTRFHSRAPPGISVRDYLNRLTFHATLPPPILLSMVFYIDRLCQYYSAFTINSLTVHRFLIAAATVASKGLSDSFWTNNTYARVGGVSIKELALLELELLSRMEWRIVPQPEMLEDYYKSLIMRSGDHQIENTAESESASNSEDAAMTEDT